MLNKFRMSLIFRIFAIKKPATHDDRRDTFADSRLVDEDQRGAGPSDSRTYGGTEEDVGTDSLIPAPDVRTQEREAHRHRQSARAF